MPLRRHHCRADLTQAYPVPPSAAMEDETLDPVVHIMFNGDNKCAGE